MYERFWKRYIDICLSILGLLLLSWLYAIIGLIIVLDDPGPVLFKQKRVGLNRSYFWLPKFRTMRLTAPHDVPTHLLKNPEQYTTRTGRFLRRYSLDELPQLWSIFIGKMSFVGPRPALWNQEDLVNERDKCGANAVKPGLTGWAQINGRDAMTIEKKAKLDGEYARIIKGGGVRAFGFDLHCFIHTFYTALSGEGFLEGKTEVTEGIEKQ